MAGTKIKLLVEFEVETEDWAHRYAMPTSAVKADAEAIYAELLVDALGQARNQVSEVVVMKPGRAQTVLAHS